MRISDWSSDVCSSDLGQALALPTRERGAVFTDNGVVAFRQFQDELVCAGQLRRLDDLLQWRPRIAERDVLAHAAVRSEERSVGKECVSTCRSRGSLCH